MSNLQENIHPRGGIPVSAGPSVAAKLQPSSPSTPSKAKTASKIPTPTVIPLRGRKFLENIDSDQLSRGKVLEWFLDKAGIRNEDEESFVIINLGSRDGRVSFLLHKLLPDKLIVGLEDNLDLLKTARNERTRILKRENKWKEPYEDEGIEIGEGEQELLGFLRFDIHHENPFKQYYGLPPHLLPDPLARASTFAPSPLSLLQNFADAVVCSHFLDNVSLPKIFAVITKVLRDGGFLLITNVHPESRLLPGFGNALISQSDTGSRQPHLHSIEEIIEEAKKWNFVFVTKGDRKITEKDVENLGSLAKRWVGACCWLGIVFELKAVK